MRCPSLRAPVSQAVTHNAASGVQRFLDDLTRVIRRDQKIHGPFPGLAPEDVAHEAILLCLDPERLATKTCRSIRAKTAKRRQRGRLNETQLCDQAVADPGAGPSERVAKREHDRALHEKIGAEIGKLPDDQRQVIELRFNQALTFDQISKHLALPNRQAAHRLYERGLAVIAPALQPVWRDVFGA